MAVQKAQEQKPAYDPSKTGPADPTNPSQPLFKNKDVQKHSDDAFARTTNGKARDGLAEAGFAIDYKNGKISFGPRVDSVTSDKPANGLQIPVDPYTIAVLHTHGDSAIPTPSGGDENSPVPNFVRSQSALYVTVPHTNTYIQLEPAP